jgi:hypothetical protein
MVQHQKPNCLVDPMHMLASTLPLVFPAPFSEGPSFLFSFQRLAIQIKWFCDFPHSFQDMLGQYFKVGCDCLLADPSHHFPIQCCAVEKDILSVSRHDTNLSQKIWFQSFLI